MRATSRLFVLSIAAIGAASCPAGAQLPDLGSVSGMLKGGGVPSINSAGIGNVAGLLGYCLKNQLLGGVNPDSASSALSALTGKPGVAGSTGFDAGQAGTVVTREGRKLPIGNLGGRIKSQVCGMVLKHARSLL